MSVSVRTRFATENERWKSFSSTTPSEPARLAVPYACLSWPRIWGSPSTMESSPLATRMRWRTAASSRCT